MSDSKDYGIWSICGEVWGIEEKTENVTILTIKRISGFGSNVKEHFIKVTLFGGLGAKAREHATQGTRVQAGGDVTTWGDKNYSELRCNSIFIMDKTKPFANDQQDSTEKERDLPF